MKLDDAYLTLRERAGTVAYDEKGYAASWQANLMAGLPLDAIAGDFGSGAGQELQQKMSAAHSSSALAVNVFGPWRLDPASLQLCGLTGFRSLRFEAVFPTGLGGVPPHLDLLLDGDVPVAVESKCTEWMTPKKALFSLSYDRLEDSLGATPWFSLMRELRAEPYRFQYVDAAQLVKHAYGLMHRYGSRPVLLAYLYWEPALSPPVLAHREEARRFAERVSGSSVSLVPMSYQDLFAVWAKQPDPPAHLPYLNARYGA